MKTKIIAVANQKGGVGKTTTVVTVAANLAYLGHWTLIVDFDPQGQCATALGLQQESGVYNLLVSPIPPSPNQVVRETGRNNLHIIPGDQFTGRAQNIMNAEGHSIDAILTALRPLMGHYQYILFDTAPSLGGLQERAIWAADAIIVPTSTQYLSSDGLAQFMKMVSNMQVKKNWQGHLMGILPTFFDEKTNESKLSLNTLIATFGGGLVLSPIHRATVLSSCPSLGMTIIEVEPHGRPAKEYKALTNFVLKSQL